MSMLRMLSMDARIAFIAFMDKDSVSLVIGGVDGLLELLTWFAWKENSFVVLLDDMVFRPSL